MRSDSIKVTDKEFINFQKLIELRIGIKFPELKRGLLESRLVNRIVKLGLTNFGEYYDYLIKNNDPDEEHFFVDKITTHTTHFFRENLHFDFLKNQGIELINENYAGEKIKILSLGVSTGEEMYTLAMIFADFKKSKIVRDYEISGADISKNAVLKAKEGIFKKEQLDSIPKKYHEYFDVDDDFITAKPKLKYNMRYFLLNAVKENQIFPDTYHIVFCRNMLIYFEKKDQQTVIDNISKILEPYGLFFSGHSESLHGIQHNLKRVVATVYMKGG